MNPKTLKSVYKQINKEELKSEKIELASSALLNQYVNTVEDTINKIDNSYKTLNSIIKEIESKKSELNRAINTGENNKKAGELIKRNGTDLLKELKRQADELGVDVDQIKNYRKLRELIDVAVGKSENLWFLVNNSIPVMSALNKI